MTARGKERRLSFYTPFVLRLTIDSRSGYAIRILTHQELTTGDKGDELSGRSDVDRPFHFPTRARNRLSNRENSAFRPIRLKTWPGQVPAGIGGWKTCGRPTGDRLRRFLLLKRPKKHFWTGRRGRRRRKGAFQVSETLKRVQKQGLAIVDNSHEVLRHSWIANGKEYEIILKVSPLPSRSFSAQESSRSWLPC